jgi:hypothetical protein
MVGEGGRSGGEYPASALRMCYNFPKALLEYEATCCAQQDAMSAEKQFLFPLPTQAEAAAATRLKHDLLCEPSGAPH